MIRGSCLCGAVRFEIDRVRALTHCHCTICRKLSGAAFVVKYRQSQISAHKSAVALFMTESEHGQAPALKSAATAALPILKMHLKMAETLPST